MKRNSTRNLTLLQTLEEHTAPVKVVKFNENGNYCMSGGYDRLIYLWNPHLNKCIKCFRGHGYQVMDLSISVDNSSFVSCGGDKQPFLWDVASGTVVRKFRGHDHMINAIHYNSDSTIFATASYDQFAKVWDCKSRSIDPIQLLEGATDSVTGIIFGETEIISCSVDGCCRTYDIRMGELRTDHIGVPLTNVSLSKCGKMILLSCLDGHLRLLDKKDGTLINQYQGQVNKEFKLDSIFLDNDEFVVSGSENGDILVWRLEDSQLVTRINAHNRMVSGLSAHIGGEYLLSCSGDNNIKLWSFSAEEPDLKHGS